MPWLEVSIMDQRREFVGFARQDGVNRRELCRRFGISATTGYKWLQRAAHGGPVLANRSTRPHTSPARTPEAVELAILAIRDHHPAWGARKIVRCLERDGLTAPAPSTVHAILKRYGRITCPDGSGSLATGRFEYDQPNQLWQMDFKGRVKLANDCWSHPLTVLDDHSRFSLCLQACQNEQTETVKDHLTTTFCHYGLPDAILVDNGSPWGGSGGGTWTRLSVWLLKLGVTVIHARPYHPQTRGKNERFHRTLKAEVFAARRFRTCSHMQAALNAWRPIYNLQRPHEALEMAVPADRYRPSKRPMPKALPKIDYPSTDTVRKVGTRKAYISFKGRLWFVPQAFRGERVAIRPQSKDGCYGIFFGAHRITEIDLTIPENRT